MRMIKPQQGRRARQALALTAAPALVVTLAAPATAGPAPSKSTGERQSTSQQARKKVPYVSKRVNTSKSRRARTARYWTPERMANAVPADSLTRGALKKKVARAANELAEQEMKATTGSRPVAPDEMAAARKRVRKSRKVGKVFFRTRRGRKMVCSGAAVNSKFKNMVLTAGHCVNGGKRRGWHKRWIFVPGYGPGNTSRHGIYHAKRLVALRGWVKRSNFNDDVGLALVRAGRGAGKKRLVRNVGGYGIQFGRKRHRRLAAVGYSAEGRFKGDKQAGCRRWTHRKWRGRSIEMKCRRMTGGSSGGPWVKGKVRGRGYVNGVNSNTNRRRKPTRVRSAYFGRDVYRMYRRWGR